MQNYEDWFLVCLQKAKNKIKRNHIQKTEHGLKHTNNYKSIQHNSPYTQGIQSKQATQLIPLQPRPSQATLRKESRQSDRAPWKSNHMYPICPVSLIEGP